jgi:cytochrome c peroxidase
MNSGYRVASAGIHARRFVAIGREGLADTGAPLSAEGSAPSQKRTRQVASRNAPSVINAVQYYRLFWDGRASNTFNGRTSYGEDDPTAFILVEDRGQLTASNVRIEDAGLASQAVDPPINSKEMSYEGRSWPTIGKRMLSARPLAKQRVASDDSVLGPFVGGAKRGLSPALTYLELIQAAFKPEYWRSKELVSAGGRVEGGAASADSEFTQAEFNFSLFFGLAVQAYESTLVADASPYDRYASGDAKALTFVQQIGLGLFRQHRCASCHVEPELTLATPVAVRGSKDYAALGPDAGFFFTGVEPTDNDSGLGARDPFGNFLSTTARNRPQAATWMRGMFKTPNLRNVELTGPYFHTGSKSTLEQVIEFYTTAGDYPTPSLLVWGPHPMDRIAMPALLKALTDERVRFERAPFDHPELCVPGEDRWASIPQVGARGNRVPLQTFEELLRGVGRDGSRAHNLVTSCSILQ